MCLSVFQDKKKRRCLASSSYVLNLNTFNKVKNTTNEGVKHGSYERVLQSKRCKTLKPVCV